MASFPSSMQMLRCLGRILFVHFSRYRYLLVMNVSTMADALDIVKCIRHDQHKIPPHMPHFKEGHCDRVDQRYWASNSSVATKMA